LVVGLSFSQFVTGFVLTPYRTAPKWTQTVPVEVGVPPTILNLDPASAECIEKTKAALADAGFKPGDDILALYGLPGLVYAVGGVSPERPWFFDSEGSSEDANNLRALRRIPKKRISNAYILLKDNDSRAFNQLLESEIAFPRLYKQIGLINFKYKNQKKSEIAIFKVYEADK
jgi:hypothetical protein